MTFTYARPPSCQPNAPRRTRHPKVICRSESSSLGVGSLRRGSLVVGSLALDRPCRLRISLTSEEMVSLLAWISTIRRIVLPRALSTRTPTSGLTCSCVPAASSVAYTSTLESWAVEFDRRRGLPKTLLSRPWTYRRGVSQRYTMCAGNISLAQGVSLSNHAELGRPLHAERRYPIRLRSRLSRRCQATRACRGVKSNLSKWLPSHLGW